MIRTAIAVVVALAAFGCTSAQQAEVAHPGQLADARLQVLEEQQPYADALAEAYRSYRADVDRAMSVTYTSDAEADAVIQSMSAQRFDGLLDISLERRGLTRDDLSTYLDDNQAFFSLMRARYHGRIDRVADDAQQVRGLVVASVTPMDDDTAGELAMADVQR